MQAHTIVLEVIEILPVKRHRKIKIAAIKSIDDPVGCFANLFLCVVSAVQIDTGLESCCFGTLEIAGECLVDFDLSIGCISDPYDNELAAGFLYGLEVDVVLPCRNIYSEGFAFSLICRNEIREILQKLNDFKIMLNCLLFFISRITSCPSPSCGFISYVNTFPFVERLIFPAVCHESYTEWSSGFFCACTAIAITQQHVMRNLFIVD